jgi:hypothetical protein
MLYLDINKKHKNMVKQLEDPIKAFVLFAIVILTLALLG